MGTRSVVAIPDAEHGFRGRYVHWDGYPSGVGEAVRQIVMRDGYATAVKTLTEDHYGWSSVNPSTDEDATLSPGYPDGRFVNVPGYGTAYTTEQGQSSPEDWQLGDGDDGGTEWAYVLTEGGVEVYERRYGDDSHATGWFGMSNDGARWVKLGYVNYTDEDGMAHIEKGE